MKYILHLLLLTTLTLFATPTQTHLLSLSPDNLAKEVSADTLIEVKYDLNISKHSLYEGAIVLKNTKHKKIEGTLSIKNKNTLLFTPDELLKSGEYRVKVKPINLQDYTLNTRFSKYAKKFCSYFYDDVKECRLYNYASRVKTKANNRVLLDAMDCNYYFSHYAEEFGDPILIDHNIDEDFENLQLNRKLRVKAYWEYDAQFSGGVYELTKSDKAKEKCNFDVTSLLGAK